MEREITRVLNENPEYRVPAKWSDIKEGDRLVMIYVYFKSKPEELYRLHFREFDSTYDNDTSTCSLGLIMQYDGDRWRREGELGGKEFDRITKRFQDEILSKVMYGYTTSD